jgi:hypothetical protein
LPLGGDARDDQFAWAVSYPACQAVPSTIRVRVTGVAGVLRHSGNLPESGVGAALVNNDGALLGIVNGDRSAAAAVSRVQSALADARTSPRQASVADVGRTENHLYGSLALRSDVSGASARVTPLEPWQWSTLGRDGAVPLTFTGPVGRYQVDLIVNGAVRASTTARLVAGTSTPVSLAPPPVAVAPPTPQPAAPPPSQAPAQPPVVRKRGSAVVPVVLLLGAGGGAAAYFLTKKNPDEEPTPTANGGISVSVPNP